MQDTQQITPKPELPAWAIETPEPSAPDTIWPPYTLMIQHPEGEQIQRVEMTRDEFLKLKATLAKMRGFEIPETEPETAPAEATAPTNGAAAQSTSIRLVSRTIDEMATALEQREAQRQKTGIALRESEERYRDLFENASVLIQSITLDGHFL